MENTSITDHHLDTLIADAQDLIDAAGPWLASRSPEDFKLAFPHLETLRSSLARIPKE